MAFKKRKPPARDRRFSENVVAFAGVDTSRDKPQALKMQARPRRHRAGFARDMVFAEFGYRHARAIECGGFVDRKPNPAPVWWRSGP